jgi:hypothetical protein
MVSESVYISEVTMKCTYCGSQNREDARFCYSCGKRLSTPISTVDNPPAYQPPINATHHPNIIPILRISPGQDTPTTKTSKSGKKRIHYVGKLIKNKVKLKDWDTWPKDYRALFLTAAGITLIIAMVLCYVSGLWAHDNMHEFFHFF